MAVNLTDAAIKKAAKTAAETGNRLDLSDAGLPGLWLRVAPTGGRSWVLSCRDNLGATRRFPLGQHPAMGISDARDAARAMREEVKKGADPIAEAKRKRMIGREARAGIGTLTVLLDLYGTKEGAKLKTWGACRKMIENVFSTHLPKPLATMKLGDLQMTADSHKAQQSAAAAVRYLRPVLKWAAHTGRGYVATDLGQIKPPATVKRRDRVLACDELAALLPTLKASSRPHAAAMRFMLLTLARREEVGAATWKAIDLDAGTWTITETKNGKPHVVPLPHQAVTLLRERLPKDEDGNATKPVPASLVFATGSGGHLSNWDRETKAIMEDSKTTGWTRHDLRRTGATMLGEMGELPNIIEAALNHVSIGGQLAATYNRSRYRPQVAAALQRLADALDGIEEGASKVVPLHQKAAAGSARQAETAKREAHHARRETIG
jgi:integrase